MTMNVSPQSVESPPRGPGRRVTSLTRKALVCMCLSVALIVGAVLVLAQTVVMDGFLRLERQFVATSLDRAELAIEEAAEGLSVKASDWAAWDDTWRFMGDRNTAYMESNLGDESIANLKLSEMVLLDTAGAIVFGRSVNVATGEGRALDPAVAEALDANPSLWRHETAESEVHGVVRTARGPMLIASRPIVTSAGEGPIRGTIVFTRVLDAEWMRQLGERLRSPLALVPAEVLSREDPELSAAVLGGSDGQRQTRELTRAYRVLACLEGQASAVLRVDRERVIMREARSTVALFLWLVLAGSVVIGAAALWLLGWGVTARVVRLNREVAAFETAPGNERVRVAERGTDEIADLAHRINQMLDSLGEQRIELERARLIAEAASRAKSDFLANMSHEIRTPMTAILGYADLLLDPDQGQSERVNSIQTIRRNGEHLLTIINDILDLSKIEARKMQVERIACSPLRIVSEVQAMMHARALGKGLTLEIVPTFPIPATIMSDPVRLRQIVVNLVGNAVKFTEQGRVGVTVAFDAGASVLRIAVSDSGVGMTAEEMGRLFRPFTQADSSTTRRFGGTGLGLTISKRLAEMLGGDLTAESTPGAGSTFTLTVATGEVGGGEMIRSASEAERHVSPVREERPAAVTTRPLEGVRILLAEDGPDNQRLIAFHLRRAGALVDVADNGRIAVDRGLEEAALGRAFHVILMDMQMPELDGYGATSLLRQKGYDRPIIALTAHAMAGDREKCLTAGCDDYHTKPIDAPRLIGLCRSHADRAGSLRAA